MYLQIHVPAHRADHVRVDVLNGAACGHGCDDRARADGVAAHALGGETERRVLRDADDRALRRDIDRAAAALQTGDGGNVDDRTVGFAKLRCRGADAVHRALRVDAEHLFIVLVGEPVDGLEALFKHAGVVDQSVQTPVGVYGGV